MSQQTVKIKTHRSLAKGEAKDGTEVCEYREQAAAYWSQASTDDHKALSCSIPHCQRHLARARYDCLVEAKTPGQYERYREEQLKELVAEDPSLLEVGDVFQLLDVAGARRNAHEELEDIARDLVKWFKYPPEVSLLALVNRARKYFGEKELT